MSTVFGAKSPSYERQKLGNNLLDTQSELFYSAFMAADSKLVNELLDALENLVIENHALSSAMALLQTYLPPAAHDHIRNCVEGIASDPDIRAMARGTLAQYAPGTLRRTVDGLLQDLKAKKVK